MLSWSSAEEGIFHVPFCTRCKFRKWEINRHTSGTLYHEIWLVVVVTVTMKQTFPIIYCSYYHTVLKKANGGRFMCKAAILGKVKRKWKYLGGLTVVQYQKKNGHFPLLPPSLFLYVFLSTPYPCFSKVIICYSVPCFISSSQVPTWCSWNSTGIFFILVSPSGMFFTNTCSWLLHLTQVFYSVVTLSVRPFLRTPTKITFIPATHTHTSYPTPGLIILFNTYHNLTYHVIYSFIMLIVFFLLSRLWAPPQRGFLSTRHFPFNVHNPFQENTCENVNWKPISHYYKWWENEWCIICQPKTHNQFPNM